MVATDTVVGIVGAVVLAAVMVGVFVYEYNNTPTVTGTNGTVDNSASIERFVTAHASLNATGDMDGDDLPNHLDTDMDNNGVPDANQTGDLVYSKAYSGTLAQPAPPATTSTMEIAFAIEAGNEGLSITFHYNTTAPTPVPGLPRSPTIEFKIVAPDGSTVLQSSQSTQSGTHVSSEASTTEPQAAGDYKLIVTETVAGPNASFGGRLNLNYGAAQ